MLLPLSDVKKCNLPRKNFPQIPPRSTKGAISKCRAHSLCATSFQTASRNSRDAGRDLHVRGWSLIGESRRAGDQRGGQDGHSAAGDRQGRNGRRRMGGEVALE